MDCRRITVALLFACLAPSLPGQTPPAPGELEEFRVTDWVVAHPAPAGTFEMPVSSLRYEWRADVQSRNLAEAQGDIAIRGGIFENTGYRLAGAGIVDPQTGHYLVELPVSPEMLSAPHILVGVNNALYGMNATVGTIEQDWRAIEDRTRISAGIGNHGLRTGSFYWGKVLGGGADGTNWAADLSWSGSEGDGTLRDGDHRFQRLSGRLQWCGPGRRTDFFAGYQSKFFQWPFLYALEALHDLVGSRGIESENLQTQLWMVTHRQEVEEGHWLATAYLRQNRDDYEFDIDRPGLFNAFEHETRAYGLGLTGRFRERAPVGVEVTLQGMADELESTALNYGPFDSRTTWRLAVMPEWRWMRDGGERWTAAAGAVYDWSNRDGGQLSPVGRLGWRCPAQAGGWWHSAVSVAESSQLPGYTAIGSNPGGGLFRGNPDLVRERSRNWEWETGYFREDFSVQAALFLRQDRDLVDWIFDRTVQPFASRFAENVDIDTRGLELLAEWRGRSVEARLGATWLRKRERYERAQVDGSFYALNFPRFRMAGGLVWTVTPGLQLQVDQEWRRQQPNPLRAGRSEAFLGQAGLRWQPWTDRPLEFTMSVENLWNVAFEQVPGVPGAGRQGVFGLAWEL